MVSALVRQIWRCNLRSGLTGEMRIAGRKVRQLIEGEAIVVLPLASRILADRRHQAIHVLAFRALNDRRHSAWLVHGIEIGGLIPADVVAEGGTLVAFHQGSAAHAAETAGRKTRSLAI